MSAYPPPDATREQVDAWHEANGLSQPSMIDWQRFDGQNCPGPCRGWDGKSRRCECGNRRVYFDSTVGGARAD